MSLVLNDQLQLDLSFLGSLGPEFVSEFCRVCVEFVEQGAKQNQLVRAAAALGADKEAVIGGVSALSELLLSAARYRTSESEVASALSDIPALPEGHRKIISEFFASNESKLRAHLASSESSGTKAQFVHLDWRLDVVVASRHAYEKMEPTFNVRLDTLVPTKSNTSSSSNSSESANSSAAGAEAVSSPSTKSSSLYASADFAALKRVADALDEASAEMKTAHTRRVTRYIR